MICGQHTKVVNSMVVDRKTNDKGQNIQTSREGPKTKESTMLHVRHVR